jgi:hypothetical protein
VCRIGSTGNQEGQADSSACGPPNSENTSLVLFSLFLFSCGAKKAPERLTVIAPEDFAGKIKVTTCTVDAKAADYVLLDASGRGSTFVCAATPDFTFRVVRGNSSVEVPAAVSKTGDDIVVSLTATVGARDAAHK